MFFVLLFLIIGGCTKKIPESNPPIVQGHRVSGVSQKPRKALKHAQEKGYPSIEIDVSLTSDLVLIVHHDYWLDKTNCAEKTPVSHQTFIKNHTWKQLREKTTCLSSGDTTILSVEEFLSSPLLSPQVLINLDVKYHPQFTRSKERFVQALVHLVSQYPNRKIMITASDLYLVQTLKKMLSVPVFIEYPFFSSTNRNHHDVMIALQAKIRMSLGITRIEELVEQSNADGISLPFQIVTLRDARRLNERGMMIQLFTVHKRKDAQRLCSWPIDILISDIPESVPCFHAISATPD